MYSLIDIIFTAERHGENRICDFTKMFEHMDISRKTFLAGTAALAAAGCTTGMKSLRLAAADEIKALLLHLGHNMWCDWFPGDMDLAALSARYAGKDGFSLPDDELRSRDDLWRRVTDHAAACGLNMIVVDLGEALVYPSHPELAIKGSWSPDKMRDEIRRLNSLGLEVIPKMNFSTTHNGWLKQYRRMVSTPPYYRVCEDLIADVAEIFGNPRFLHIGCDEERSALQRSVPRYMHVVERRHEFWMHDFIHLVRTCEKHGMRAWTWSDYGWEHPDFYAQCPKSVLHSNWFYDSDCGGFEISESKTNGRKQLAAFYDLEKAGFDQVPCGTNWVGWKRKKLGIGADDVIGKLVKVCRRDIPANHLKGFLMAPWASCDTQEHADFNIKGIDLFAEALRS